MWNSKVQRLKEHIFNKRQKQSKISYLKANIKVNEVLIHLDYSENYKSQDQNEIQSAYFGHPSFSLFTACPYYRCSKTKEINTFNYLRQKSDGPCFIENYQKDGYGIYCE